MNIDATSTICCLTVCEVITLAVAHQLNLPSHLWQRCSIPVLLSLQRVGSRSESQTRWPSAVSLTLRYRTVYLGLGIWDPLPQALCNALPSLQSG